VTGAISTRGSRRPRIVAYIDEEGQYDYVAVQAVEQAADWDGTLILYDSSAASAFTEPIASDMSAQGEGEQFGDPLRADELHRLGRPSIAGLVEEARDRGVDAWGWLPSERGVGGFLRYGDEHGADLLILPMEAADSTVEDTDPNRRVRPGTAPGKRVEGASWIMLVEPRTGHDAESS
jgi:hypothetical protein